MKAEPGPAPTTQPSRTSPLQTVDRALQILASFTPSQHDWGVSELAARFGWDKSTAQRLLASLAARGFLISDPVTRRYSLGPQVWRLAQDWERSGGLAEFAIPTMTELAQASGRDIVFAIPDGAYVRCIAEVSGRLGSVRITPLVGELYPAHAGATSRAYFAFLDRSLRRQMLAGRPKARYGDLTVTDEEELEQLFAATVEDGFAYSNGEYDPATRALAVPVRVGTSIIGSLSLGERKTEQPDDLHGHLPALLAAADKLGERLAGRRFL
ncbi:IclR family transcriptional regulator [Propionimicrobium sp. PCR01-08-3]|uniref:IclR family transcriptional regulator n=1 Tax=Propionimicrobium sp. PCR01-08-3 TaxID=3052086 RepID=UPI00255C644A|nr:IclR family transcriptional regulator [Propionimicrobium sp. PCR01-08-3]WIY83208.1 IclR family transcriptional regulator [Propionimicrobium sp. PCR01-08-3]